MKGVGLVLLLVAVSGLVWWYTLDKDPGAAVTEPAPRLELGPRLRLVQRNDAAVPGSGGRLRAHVGDITRGQVELTLSLEDGTTPLPARSVRQGDRVTFELDGRQYQVRVLDLVNRIVGDDHVVLDFSAGLDHAQRIELLLEALEASPATFIRNGKEYQGKEAAAHLRRKWNFAKSRIRTVDDFIDRIATKSSMSGKLYTVRLEDGTTLETRVWLRRQPH